MRLKKEGDMHWFKILLVTLLCMNVLFYLWRSRKGEYTEHRRAYEAPLGAVLELLVLWGVITYL